MHFFKISIDLDILMKTLHICHSPVNFITSLLPLSPISSVGHAVSLFHWLLLFIFMPCTLLYVGSAICCIRQCSSFPFSHFTLSFNLLSLSRFGSLPNPFLLRWKGNDWLFHIRGRETPHMKVVGMLVGSLRGVNFRFWSHLGCSGQNTIIFSREGLV